MQRQAARAPLSLDKDAFDFLDTFLIRLFGVESVHLSGRTDWLFLTIATLGTEAFIAGASLATAEWLEYAGNT
jgi:hypothetical protein